MSVEILQVHLPERGNSLPIPCKPDDAEMPDSQLLDNLVSPAIKPVTFFDARISTWLIVALRLGVSLVSAIRVDVGRWSCGGSGGG